MSARRTARASRSPSRPRRLLLLAAASVVALLMAGASPAAGATNACARSAKLVPSCGVLWGMYRPGPDFAGNLATMEQQTGRAFDVVKRYHDFSNSGSNGIFPDAAERSQAASGHVLDLTWETRVYGYRDPSLPAPAGQWNGQALPVYTYDQITGGALDREIDAVAGRVRTLGSSVFIDFNHEADLSAALGYGSNANRAAAGTPAGYRAAFRYLVNRFRADGATNVVWVWQVSGYAGVPDAALQALYPGDDVVDWIGWDPYNCSTSCRKAWTDPTTLFGGFYTRLDGGMLGPDAAAKPRALSEYGSAADPLRPAWMQALPVALAALPKIKSMSYFSSGAWGDFSDDPVSMAAHGVAGNDPIVTGLPTG